MDDSDDDSRFENCTYSVLHVATTARRLMIIPLFTEVSSKPPTSRHVVVASLINQSNPSE